MTRMVAISLLAVVLAPVGEGVQPCGMLLLIVATAVLHA